MQELKGCKKKDKRTLKSKLTNLRPTKLKADIRAYLPFKYTLRDKFPPVYLQKHGDCTSNAVLGCDDFLHHGSGWMPSTVFTYFNQKKDEVPMRDDGSSVEIALDMVKKYGVCDSQIWSNDNPWNLKPSKEAYADGIKGKRLKNWYEIKNMKQLKKALVSGYPVAGAVAWAFSRYDENYILDDPSDKAIDECVGHAIVIVGYDDISQLIEIRNSWGEGWGDHGYAFIPYRTFKRVIWWEDTYAVTG